MASNEKKYGLIDPKKKPSVADVFNNDSDSDQDRGSKDWIKKKLQKDAERGLKKQTVIDMNRALEQDPTVYQYDEVYENMKQPEAQEKPKQERKAKYMDALLKTADRRKKENERRTERLAQKERETEGDEFKDKEEFITTAYRQKLEEMKKAEEDEKKMEYIESINDVTKQKDMGSFYRQLYKETVSVEQGSNSEDKEKGKEPAQSVGEKPPATSSSSSASSSGSSSSSSSGEEDEDISDLKKKLKDAKSKLANVTADENEGSSTGKSNLEDGEARSSATEEERTKTAAVTPMPLMSVPVVVPQETVKDTKFGSNTSRKERSYRQRAQSPQRDDSKIENKRREGGRSPRERERREDGKSPQRDRERRRSPTRNSQKTNERYTRDERNRDKDRERENSRRDDWRGRPDDRSRRDDRRRRSRSPVNRSSVQTSPKRTTERRDTKRPRDPSEDKGNKKSKPEENKPIEVKPTQKVLSVKPIVVPSKGNNVENTTPKNNANTTKVDIWAKRTVGPRLEAAVQRYFQRKAAQGS